MTSIFDKIFRDKIFMGVVFLLSVMIGLMTGCGRTETEPESPAEEISGQNTAEDVLSKMSVGADEMLSTGAGTEELPGTSTEKVGDTSDMAAVTEADSWYGSYIVKDYIIRGVTAIGNDEAEGLMCLLVEYGPDEFNSDGILLEAPAYKGTPVSREEFAAMYGGSGGGCTFETFEIEEDSLLEVTIENSTELGNTFYVWDEDRILIYYRGAFLIAERGERPDIVLTDENKSFLQAMCYYMPAFTGIWETEMPEFKPAFEDMEAGQTALYYRDGYYYIGESDFGEEEYCFRDMEVLRERYGTSAFVNYDILLHNVDSGEQEVVGTVRFDLDYADNANGFTIVSKEVNYD